MYIIDRHHCEKQNQNHHGQWFDRLSINKSVRNPPPPPLIARRSKLSSSPMQCCSQSDRHSDSQSSSQPAERERGGRETTLPCGCALPHVADAAFERLGGVLEGADATVPVAAAVVRARLGLSFWPGEQIIKYMLTKKLTIIVIILIRLKRGQVKSWFHMK